MDTPIRYKANLSLLQSAGVEAVEEMLMALMPGSHFGVAIFEDDDFKKHNVTYLLFKEVPQKVRVSVTGGQSLQQALLTIASLNAHVRFQLSGKSFFSESSRFGKEQVQMLMVLSTETEVDCYGNLVNK